MKPFREQLRQHSVAIISLAVALTSLAYNTWRNERTEANRNVRTAGVELLLQLGELEQVSFFAQFDMDNARGNPRRGWAIVLLVRDLGMLLPQPATDSATALYDAWKAGWEGLGESRTDYDRISVAIDRGRDDTRTVLLALD